MMSPLSTARKSVWPISCRKIWQLVSSGLAAVWSEENTRESMFEAIKRREVYATSGTRIKLRFFGGWEYEAGGCIAG